MPTYSYKCPDCGTTFDRICSIADMEAWEATRPKHCSQMEVVRDYARVPSHIPFHAGTYEHLGLDPVEITSAQQLRDECKKRGLYSQYMLDMGGVFGAKEGRWI